MPVILEDGFWKQADTVTSALVHVSILLATIGAAIKFRLLHLLSRRYKSELVCRHHVLSHDRVVFEAEYTVNNTGERPIELTRVSLRLCAAETRGRLLAPDQERTFAERLLEWNDSDKKGLFHIEAGERSTFTLRTMLTELEPVAFVMCQLSWKDKRQPAPYISLYVRADAENKTPQPEATAKAAGASR